MEPRVSVITLGVKNMKKSRAFYEKLGFKASSASQTDVTFFDLSGVVLCLFPTKDLMHDAGIKKKGEGFGNVALAHNVRDKKDVDKVMAHAKKCGAKILRKADDVFWGGYNGYFADPDGHAWEVAWNPLWPMGRKGEIKLPK